MKKAKKVISFILVLTMLFTLNFNVAYADEDDNEPVKFVLSGRQSNADMKKMREQIVYQQSALFKGDIKEKSDCPSNHYSLINGDDRTLLKSFISQIVFIMIKYNDVSEPVYATGFYAGRGKILTVAHAVIGDGSKTIEWATAYFILGDPDTSFHVQSSPIYNAYITKYYQRNVSKGYDYAVLRTQGEIYYNNTRLEPLKLAQPEELPYYATLFPYVCGFPDARTHCCVQHSGGGTLHDEEGNRYYYDIDIEPGQSGAPIFVRDANNKIVVIGIHTDGAGITYSPYPNLNSGIKLRYEVHEFLNSCEW